jgi:uncharacterized protein (TIRG00374 family)
VTAAGPAGEPASREAGPGAPGEERRRRKSLPGLLKLLVALALLGWVAWSLPWTDSLVFVTDSSGAREELVLPGTIRGGWRGEAVVFALEAGVVAPAGWPESLRAQARHGEELRVLRRAPEAQGFDWRPGMPRVLLDLQGRSLLSAFAGLLLGLAFGVTRWWRLLHLAGCPSTWLNTLRLTFLGLFFNLVLPGLTGGDLPKAVLVVREHPERRADAFATVVIDRLVGLWSLVLIANGILWTTVGFEVLRIPSGLTLLGMTLGLLFVLLPGPRRALGLARWIERLPQARRLKKLEQAALIYRGRPAELVGSVLLSFGNHLSVILAVYSIGSAFGDSLSLRDYVGIVPVANLISALPLTPGGWGVGEAVYGELFQRMGDVATVGVAVSVTFRLCNVVLGLLGGLFMLLPGGRVIRREVLEADVELVD